MERLIGWFWTGEHYFKWIYSDTFQKWLHWEGTVNDPGGWFLRTEQDVVYYEKDILRMQVREDVIEILPDLRGVSDYVQYSSYFSRSEIVSIVLELNRFGMSSTLDKILQFDFSY